MATPRQIKQRAKEIDELYAQRQAEEQEAQAQQQQSDDSEAAQQAGEGEQPPAEGQTDDPNVTVLQTGGAQEPREPEVPPAEDSVAQLRRELEEVNQRYRTLQGMIRQKDDENQRLNTLLAQMQQAPEPAAEQPTQEPQNSVEARDREDFGDDLVDMVQRIVQREVGDFGNRIAQLESVSRETHASTTETRKERFESRLTERVPNWRDLDQDPLFTQWLNSSTTRVEIARTAMQKFDASAIAELFEMYLAVAGQPTGGSTDSPAEAPAPSASRSLEEKVAPSKGRTSTPSSSTEKKMWTRTEIAQVFSNRRSYSQKEFDELQRDIFAAQKEGRVDYAR